MKNRHLASHPRKIFHCLLFLIFTMGSTLANNQKTEILWDAYGVPHIYGKDMTEMYHAYGWAQMENHADLILHLYAEARGRASEYWGADYFESDRRIWLFSIPDQARENYHNQDLTYKTYVDAFAQGMNDYARTYPESIANEVKQVLPVSGEDVMAHVLRVLCLEFVAGEDIYSVNSILGKGSNAYAIAPSRSASGNAMLMTNPHLPWEGFFLWFEAHLVSGEFNAYGISLIGVPTLTMAFNKDLGWAMTVNTMDGSDRYELALERDGYLMDDQWRAFEKKSHQFRLLQDDGTMKIVDVDYEYSEHGPVIGKKEKSAYAIRIVGLENGNIFEQYHKMSAATNLIEFETALKMLQNPMFNIIYADRSGNILYLFNGNVPNRSSGDFAFWKGTIDGTKSEYIWRRTHDYIDLPKVLNPPSGFLQNCNDPPWTCTFPPVLNAADFPDYMAPRFMHLRAQRSTNMILDDQHQSISFDQLRSYKLNTGMEAADRFLDDLLLAAEKFPDSTALRATSVLKTWDRKTETDSRGAILFANWFDRMDNSMFDVPWDPARPSNTPDGIKDQKTAVRLLATAANEVQQKYGALDIRWGEIYRFRMNGIDYPANGGPGKYGIFRTIDFRADVDNKKSACFGDTYVAIVEFSDPVKAEVLLSYGNASQPANKHAGDQFKLMSDKKLRPALLAREEVLKNLEKREKPIKSRKETSW